MQPFFFFPICLRKKIGVTSTSHGYSEEAKMENRSNIKDERIKTASTVMLLFK